MLVGMEVDAITLENGMESPQKKKRERENYYVIQQSIEFQSVKSLNFVVRETWACINGCVTLDQLYDSYGLGFSHW